MISTQTLHHAKLFIIHTLFTFYLNLIRNIYTLHTPEQSSHTHAGSSGTVMKPLNESGAFPTESTRRFTVIPP